MHRYRTNIGLRCGEMKSSDAYLMIMANEKTETNIKHGSANRYYLDIMGPQHYQENKTKP